MLIGRYLVGDLPNVFILFSVKCFLYKDNRDTYFFRASSAPVSAGRSGWRRQQQQRAPQLRQTCHICLLSKVPDSLHLWQLDCGPTLVIPLVINSKVQLRSTWDWWLPVKKSCLCRIGTNSKIFLSSNLSSLDTPIFFNFGSGSKNYFVCLFISEIQH